MHRMMRGHHYVGCAVNQCAQTSFRSSMYVLLYALADFHALRLPDQGCHGGQCQ